MQAAESYPGELESRSKGGTFKFVIPYVNPKIFVGSANGEV